MKAAVHATFLLGIILGSSLPGEEQSGQFESIDSMTLRIDNDFLAGTDARYTAGTELAIGFQPWAATRKDREAYHATLAVGQLVFTPEDVRNPEIVRDDRPYAGWGYLRYALSRHREDTLDTWGTTIGMVGPSSFAEDAQRAIHQALDDHFPEGWTHQLRDELGVNLTWQRVRRRWAVELGNERSLQVAQLTELSLGNVDTSASLGFNIRFGRRLPKEIAAPDRIGEAAPLLLASRGDRAPWFAPAHGRFHWILGANATYVGRNLFLDGNTSGGSHSVDKRRLVAEAELGFAYSRDRFRAAFLYVYRSAEFKAQEGGQGFTSISVTFAH